MKISEVGMNKKQSKLEAGVKVRALLKSDGEMTLQFILKTEGAGLLGVGV